MTNRKYISRESYNLANDEKRQNTIYFNFSSFRCPIKATSWSLCKPRATNVSQR